MRRPILVAALALTLTACSSPASREAMTPQLLAIDKHHPYSLRVQTNGGSETGGLDSTNIADADLKAAIENAVIRNRVFKSVIQGGGGDYELNVQVISLRRPMIGVTLDVELEMGWSLVRSSDRTVLMRKSVQSTGQAGIGDAIAFVTRLQLAVEMAARNNIAEGLKAISKLKL